MQPCFSLLGGLLLVAVVRSQTCCPPMGIWSEWTSIVPCNDTCGSCGYETKIRTCVSVDSGCPCNGSATYSGACASSVCLFPKTSCCPGFSKMIDQTHKTFYCGPADVNPVYPQECCNSTAGFWATWSEWAVCNPDCGTCGTRTRTRKCASTPYGCNCNGQSSENQTVSCPGTLGCPSGSPQVCCNGLTPQTQTDGSVICQNSTNPCCPPLGIWSEWTWRIPCNDTCGMCGYEDKFRTCVSADSGCPCTGSDTYTGGCTHAQCLFPRHTCCLPYKQMLYAPKKLFYCGPAEIDPVYPPECCNSPDGYWASWSDWSVCDPDCGTCGNRTRTRSCASTPYGCNCNGQTSENQTVSCPGTLGCPSGSPQVCCNGLTPQAQTDGSVICQNSTNPCCPPLGIWSEWTWRIPCNDTCGMCGYEDKFRTCVSADSGCPCTGSDTYTGGCTHAQCLFPRHTCCLPYRQMMYAPSFLFYCGPAEVAPVYPKECCNGNVGYWAPWSDWTLCTPNCGTCGNRTRTRICASTPYGCNCYGKTSENQTLSCPGTQGCPPGSPQVCCNGLIPEVQDSDGSVVCQKIPLACCCPPNGIWSEWAVVTPCNDTCGSCGFESKTRVCTSTSYGCPCNGSATYSGACGISVCLFPRTSCCPGFSKMIDPTHKTFYCGPADVNPDLSTNNCCGGGGRSGLTEGYWGAWTEATPCTATCGLCGTQTRTRVCDSDRYGCPCTGSNTTTSACGAAACPGPTCCSGFVGSDAATGQLACTATQCCPSMGIWGPWDRSGICSDTCGRYGTRTITRTCLSDSFDCPCIGSSTATETCNILACDPPRAPCAPGTTEFDSDVLVGGRICLTDDLEEATPPVEPYCCANRTKDEDYLAYYNTEKSSTKDEITACVNKPACGACQYMSFYRDCVAKKYGCDCGTGHVTKVIQPCYNNVTVCAAPAQPCCGPVAQLNTTSNTCYYPVTSFTDDYS